MFNYTINDIDESYNGRSGCMCGCNGTFNHPSLSNPVDSNDKAVKIALKKINDALNFVGPYPKNIRVGYDAVSAWLDTGKRTTVIFFNTSEA